MTSGVGEIEPLREHDGRQEHDTHRSAPALFCVDCHNRGSALRASCGKTAILRSFELLSRLPGGCYQSVTQRTSRLDEIWSGGTRRAIHVHRTSLWLGLLYHASARMELPTHHGYFVTPLVSLIMYAVRLILLFHRVRQVLQRRGPESHGGGRFGGLRSRRVQSYYTW